MEQFKQGILEKIENGNIKSAFNKLNSKLVRSSIPFQDFLDYKKRWEALQRDKGQSFYQEDLETFKFQLTAFVQSLMKGDLILRSPSKEKSKNKPSRSMVDKTPKTIYDIDDFSEFEPSDKSDFDEIEEEVVGEDEEEMMPMPAVEKEKSPISEKSDKGGFSFRGLLNRYKKLFTKSDKGKLVCSLPKLFEFNEINTVKVRIAKSEIKDAILESGLSETNLEKSEIEIGEVMVVDIFESSGEDNFEITSLNNKEQIIDIRRDEFKEWIYHVKPKRTGHFALIIRVSILKHIKNLGVKKEDLLVWCKEVEVSVEDISNHEEREENVPMGITLTDKKLLQLKDELAVNNIGIVFQDLSNRLQFKDIELFNRLVVLQSKYYHLKTDYNSGIIEYDDFSTKEIGIIALLLTIIDLIDEDNSELENKNYEKELERLEGILN